MAIANALTLRGQMKYMTDWDAIIFLGVPMWVTLPACPEYRYGNKFFIQQILLSFFSLRDISSMQSCGLYLNDLSMHDSSRDLVLSGEQQSAELKSALEQVIL